jgi:hypothetical protein
MANLKAGTLIGGNLIWHQGNLEFNTVDTRLDYKGHMVYTEAHKPTNNDLNLVSRAGDTMTGVLKFSTSISDVIQDGSNNRLLHNGGFVVLGNSTKSTGIDGGTTRLTVQTGSISANVPYLTTVAQHSSANSLTRKDYVDNTTVSVSGDTMTGVLNINANNGFMVANSDANQASYILGKIAGANSWYVGRGSTSTSDVSLQSYTHSNRRITIQSDGVYIYGSGQEGKIYTTGNKPTVIDIAGAVRDTGDTMTGALTITTANADPKLIIHRTNLDGNVSIGFKTQNNTMLYFGRRSDGHFAYHDDLDLSAASASKIYSTSFKPTTADVGALPAAGKAVDSDKLDGLDSSQFLRSDASDSFSGDLVSTSRDKGIFGTYDSTKTDQIWSMGTAYRNAADGSDFGNLYGLAYKHTNNTTGGQMAGGHQMVWVTNGTHKAALGDSGIWSSGYVDAGGKIITTVNTGFGVIHQRAGHQTMIGCADIVGDYLVGGRPSDAADWTDYIRIARNKLRYCTNSDHTGKRIYHEGDKPSLAEINAVRGQQVSGLASGVQWHKAMTVVMPNNASTIKLEITGGNGFNVGIESQLGTQTIQFRTGNGSPATGLTVVGFYDGGMSLAITDVGYKHISGSTYEIYLKSSSYPDSGLIYMLTTSMNASAVWNRVAVGTAEPTGITKWSENNVIYNSRAKPTSSDVNAVAKTGDTMTGALTFTGHNGIKMKDGKKVLWSHDNKAVTLSASGSDGILYLGYSSGTDYQTDKVVMHRPLYASNGTTLLCDTSGQLYDVGQRVYSEYHKPTPAEVGAVNKAGDTMTGNLSWTQNGSCHIGAGQGDGASFTTTNINIKSWFGVGFESTIDNQAVPKGENAAYIDTRGGHMGIRGDFRANKSITAGTGLGLSNASSTSKLGLSLHGGGKEGKPEYGMMFTGTVGSGTHGGVTGDWATYLTMSDTTNRGWIFQRGSTNVASISGSGFIEANSGVSSIARKLTGAIDLNSYVKTESFNVYATGSMTNKPPAGCDYGTLQVIGSNSTSGQFVTQTFVERNGNRMAIRGRNDGGGSWSAWKNVYTEGFKPNSLWQTGTGGGGLHINYDNEINFTSSSAELYFNYRQVGGTKISAMSFNAGENDKNATLKFGSADMKGTINRQSHSSGYLVGSYNNVGDNSIKTNPIYAIGTNYKPSDTALGNMYGIGYCVAGASTPFIPESLRSGSWGMYVAADGDARVFLDGGNGQIRSTGAHVGSGFKTHKGAYSYLQLSGTAGSYMMIECNGSKGLNIISRNDDNSNRYVWSFTDDGEFISPSSIKTSNQMYINNGSPTLWFQDTDSRSCAWHCNSNLMYLLRGTGNNATSWDSGPNGRHPATFNLETGDVVFSGNVTAYSDRRLKTNIHNVENAVEKVSKLNGVIYEWKNDTAGVGEQAGVIAQDVQEVLPQAVLEDKEGNLTVAYAQLSALFVEAIKEQQKQIETLTKRVNELSK